MRIGRSVSVTGEVFDGGQHSAFVRALDISRDQIADLLRVFSEGTRINDGIRRVRVNIGVGKEIPLYADGTRFLGTDAAEGLNVFGLAISAESHGVREDGGAHQPHGDAALKIGGKYQRKFGFFLQTVAEFR